MSMGVGDVRGFQVTRAATGARLWHAVVTVAVAGTAVRCPAGAPDMLGVRLQGADANVGDVFVGDDAVTNSAGVKPGYRLAAGAVLELPLHSVRDLWVNADNNGDDLVIVGVAA